MSVQWSQCHLQEGLEAVLDKDQCNPFVLILQYYKDGPRVWGSRTREYGHKE